MRQDTLPRWADSLVGLTERVLAPAGAGAGGGGGGVRLNVVIDAHKAATGPFVLALMTVYGNWSAAAWVYLALHGSYGIAWVLKDLALPDRRWRRRVRPGGAAAAAVFLSLYWVAPFLLVSGLPGPGWAPASTPWLAAAIALHTLGLVLMIGADAQKNLTLRQRPGLITDGFYRRVRHPNYLGEMMVYGAYAVVVSHWLPWAILAAVWGLLFLPGMLTIDASLSRYPEYRAWRRWAGLLWPRWGQARPPRGR